MAEQLEVRTNGPRGPKGWTPVFLPLTDGARKLVRITSWQGGAGDMPATGYIGASGLTDDIAQATDFAGRSVASLSAIADSTDILVTYADGGTQVVASYFAPFIAAAADVTENTLAVSQMLSMVESKRSEVAGNTQIVSDAKVEMLAAYGSTQALTNAVSGAQAAKTGAETALGAMQNGIPKGPWNAATNSPALTATPNALFPDGSYYENQVAGVLPFATINYPIGAPVPVEAKLKKLGTQWYLVLPSGTALAKATKAEGDLYPVEVVGWSVFTGDTTGSGTVNRCIVNTQKIVQRAGKALKLVGKWSNNGSTTGTINLVQFRKSGNTYTQVSVTAITVTSVAVTLEIDLSAYNIPVLAGDVFGIQNVSGTVALRAKTSAGAGKGYVTADPVSDSLSYTATQVETDPGNGAFFMYDVYVQANFVTEYKAKTDLNTSAIAENAANIALINPAAITAQLYDTYTTTDPASTVAAEASTGWNSNAFSGWATGYKPANNSGKFSKVRMYLGQVNANEKLQLKIFKRPIANENASTATSYPGALAGDILLETKDFSTSLFANTANLQAVDLAFTPVQKDTNYIFLVSVKGLLAGGGVGVLGSDRKAVTAGTLKQYEIGWYNNQTTGSANPVSTTTSGFQVSRIFYEETEHTDARISRAENNITALQSSVAVVNASIVSLNNRIPVKTNFGTVLHSNTFATISADFVATNWGTVAGGVSPSAYGLANNLRLNKQYNISPRTCRIKVTMGATTRLLLHTVSQEGEVGLATVVECDASASKLRIYAPYYSTTATLPAMLSEKAYTFVAGRDYLVELERINFTNTIRVIDTVTGLSDSLSDATKGSGRCHDNFAVSCLSGTYPIVKELKVVTSTKRGCRAVPEGDSITEAAYFPLNWGEGYAMQLLTLLGGDGAVSGRGGGTIAGVLRRIETEIAIIRPVYVPIMIGTNGGNTLANLTQACNRIIELGCIPILNNIPRKGDGGDVAANAIIETVRVNLGLSGCRFDLATSLNYTIADGQDQSVFNSDSGVWVHPNLAGMTRMAARWKLDTPELLD